MMTIIYMVVLFGAIGFLGYYIMNMGKSKKGENKKENSNKKNESSIIATTSTEKKGYKNPDRTIPRQDMEKFMEFDRIQDDMIVQNDGNKFTMIVQCKGINYDLMSEVEQLAVEEGFITFLNTLKFPIQLYVQARTINLKTSLDIYKSKVLEINKEFEQKNAELTKVSRDLNATQDDIDRANVEREKIANIAEYAQDITRYVEKLSVNKHMLQRKFYVILSYFKSEINATSSFSAEEINDICYRELYTRAQGVIGSLQACSVTGKILTSNEIAELLYVSYNRDDEKIIDIKTALESGFYRMYSTARDVQDKRKELLDKQIQEEAMIRVKEAIEEAIRTGIIQSEDQLEEEYENTADFTALNIVENSDLSEKDKQAVQKVIAEKHNKGVDERENARIKEAEEKFAAQQARMAQKNQKVVEEPVQQQDTDIPVANPIVEDNIIQEEVNMQDEIDTSEEAIIAPRNNEPVENNTSDGADDQIV